MKKFNKILVQLLLVIFLFYADVSLANATDSVKFFSSNNAEEIDMRTAFRRLMGKKQRELQDRINVVMKKNYLAKWGLEDILGVYYIISDKKITGDNTEELIIPSSQKLNDEKIFFIAKELANSLKQESVAVFIPCSQSDVSDIILEFSSSKPTLNEAIYLLSKRLPAVYSESFSLHFIKQDADFNTVRISSIEWLGSKVKIDKIRKSFPHQKIIYQHGKSFLVYKNGHRESL